MQSDVNNFKAMEIRDCVSDCIVVASEMFHRSSSFKQTPLNEMLFTLREIFGDFEIILEDSNGDAYLSKVF